MSVVIACGYPEEVIILCDSRISYGRVESKDNLRKIYQLGPMLAVGYTSNDVEFTIELLRRITNYATSKAKSTASLYLMDKIPKVAKYHYNEMVKATGKKPLMEFTYAGMVKDRCISVNQAEIFDLMRTQGGGRIPPKIAKALMNNSSAKYLMLDPPSPLLSKQIFPTGESSLFIGLGFTVSGTGSGIYSELEKEGGNLFFSDADFPMRVQILRMICDDYIKKSEISSIGGSVQVLRINEKGLSAMSYTHGQYNDQGEQVLTEKMSFVNGEWIVEDLVNNKVEKIVQNPLKLFGKANIKYKK